MRGGLVVGLVLACAVACGSKTGDEFDEEPQKGQGGDGSAGRGGDTAAAAAMGGAAMAGSASGTVCAPGATQACLGPGQCPGAQRCSAEGDGWGECDCGSGAEGGSTAGSGAGAVAGMSATPGQGGTSSGGGSSGEDCETDFCDAYCDAATGHCANDVSREDCMTQCAETRCTTQRGCLDQGADYFKCVAGSTPVCIADVSLPGDGDCQDEGNAFFDCLDVPWHCQEEAGSDVCICSRSRDLTGPAQCRVAYDCCVASITGVACGCDDVEFCADLGAGYVKTESCPVR